MTVGDDFEQFIRQAAEVRCCKCGSGTGIRILPWGPEEQKVICNKCSGRTFDERCSICSNIGRVYIPSFSQPVTAAGIAEGSERFHPFPSKVYYVSCSCICANGHKFRVKDVDEKDGSIIFSSHPDNPATKTFIERGYRETETISFREFISKGQDQRSSSEEEEVIW